MIKAVLIDLDGVILRGETPIEGSIDRVHELRKNFNVLFLSNNSTRSRVSFAQKLETMGMEVSPDEIVNSAYATARYLAERGTFEVHVVGEKGLKEELRNAGHLVVDRGADYVVAGMDRKVTYQKLDDGLQELLQGALFVATNIDPTYPTEDGQHPGAGCVVGAFRGMGFDPETVVGKPSEELMLYAAETVGAEPEECVVVGDREETDIEGAHRAGMKSVLVKSGVSDGPDSDKADLVVENLASLTDEQIRDL